jgi:hypothetical protein
MEEASVLAVTREGVNLTADHLAVGDARSSSSDDDADAERVDEEGANE